MTGDNRRLLGHSWHANALAWTRAVREGRIESRRLATDRAILDAVLAHRPARVLDLGCGEGWLSRALAAQGLAVLGIDASRPLVEAAQRAGGEFRCLDYAGLQADPGQLGVFEAVVCNFSVFDEHLEPLLAALGELLAADGVLLIQTLHPWLVRGEEGYRDGWRCENFAAFAGEFPEPMPWYFRTLESWCGLLLRSGYRIDALREPAHPHTGEPLSLLLEARPVSSGPS
ncbi:methyltransferase domain-containing protein [Pseudomonas sp. BN415]|uniref:class I SAM-dependent methyltransferase n=1 Tax=Pseudomonas sp. BN415 TaxID=2567889 RepID=UPI002455051B|nr:methyltransferase domain-containing protein [Pseudomonas sp. BN415]MDH4580926.1 methyltransferase domain-containing protein [Pseudomonas sp. BN415]